MIRQIVMILEGLKIYLNYKTRFKKNQKLKIKFMKDK